MQQNIQVGMWHGLTKISVRPQTRSLKVKMKFNLKLLKNQMKHKFNFHPSAPDNSRYWSHLNPQITVSKDTTNRQICTA